MFPLTLFIPHKVSTLGQANTVQPLLNCFNSYFAFVPSTPLVIMFLSISKILWILLLVYFLKNIKNEGIIKYLHTGCPKKNALLSLKAYNSGLEAAIGASRDSFGILWLWAFIWDQEVQDYVKASLRKSHLKLATLSITKNC